MGLSSLDGHSTALGLAQLPEQLHAALDVERGAHARQRQPQLDQRDRDGRAHADHDRLGVEHARHRRDVADHAADERVDDLERGDVDQDAARPVWTMRSRQVVLQRHREAVVHVDLDRHQQARRPS